MRFKVDRGALISISNPPIRVWCKNCEIEMDYVGEVQKNKQTQLVYYWNCWDCGRTEEIGFKEIEEMEGKEDIELFKYFTKIDSDVEARMKFLLSEI